MKEKIESIKRWVRAHPWQSVLLVLGTTYVSGLLSLAIKTIVLLPKVLNKEITSPFTWNPLKVYQELFTTGRGYLCLLLVILIFWAVKRFIVDPRNKKERGKADQRGFRVLTEQGTYGTSELIFDPTELGDVLDVKPVGETEGVILGKPLSVDTSDIKEDTPASVKAKIPVISLCSDAEYKKKGKARN